MTGSAVGSSNFKELKGSVGDHQFQGAERIGILKGVHAVESINVKELKGKVDREQERVYRGKGVKKIAI